MYLSMWPSKYAFVRLYSHILICIIQFEPNNRNNFFTYFHLYSRIVTLSIVLVYYFREWIYFLKGKISIIRIFRFFRIFFWKFFFHSLFLLICHSVRNFMKHTQLGFTNLLLTRAICCSMYHIKRNYFNPNPPICLLFCNVLLFRPGGYGLKMTKKKDKFNLYIHF